MYNIVSTYCHCILSAVWKEDCSFTSNFEEGWDDNKENTNKQLL